MSQESISIIDASNGAISAHSRLKEIKIKLTEIGKSINDLEYDLILLIFMPELGMPHTEKTSSGEEKKVITINPVEIIDQLDTVRSIKTDLGNAEYFWTEILYQNLKQEDKKIGLTQKVSSGRVPERT